MSEYQIQITETLSKTIIVEADSIEDAEMIAQDMYRNEEIVLTPDDYDYTDMTYIGEIYDSNNITDKG